MLRYLASTQYRSKARILLTTGVALAFLIVPSAMSRGPIPDYALKVAGGKFDQKSSWGVWVFGARHAGRCWATKSVESSLVNEDAYCGFSVPPRYWQLAARGSFGRGTSQRSMLFFLTRKDVGSVGVLMDFNQNGRPAWVQVKAQAISADQARHAHMHSNFGYAVLMFPGPPGCLKQIAVFDRIGTRIEKSRPVRCDAQHQLSDHHM
jgi:hypothetical protein